MRRTVSNVTAARFALPILLALLPASAAVRADDAPEIEYRRDIKYGSAGGEDLLLDLATPKNLERPAPVIVAIHGGGWAGGDKNMFEGFAQQAARQGYVCVTINYRHAPKHRWPAQIEDSKCAVRWLRAHADELKIDPRRIGALGASAGAHLAMLLGAMDSADGLEGNGGWPDQSSKVQAVVAIFGPTNLESDFPPITDPILETFLGGKLADQAELYRQASPINYVTTGDAPMLLFQGTKDVLVPYDQAIQMATALSKASVPGRVELLIGANHGWDGKELERTTRASLEFLDGRLKQ